MIEDITFDQHLESSTQDASNEEPAANNSGNKTKNSGNKRSRKKAEAKAKVRKPKEIYICSPIDTPDASYATEFRVSAGPYKTQAEALKVVRKELLEGSYVLMQQLAIANKQVTESVKTVVS